MSRKAIAIIIIILLILYFLPAIIFIITGEWGFGSFLTRGYYFWKGFINAVIQEFSK